MPKLSAVIITYNEQKNIRRCLESILDIVDDITIVDSYSTDETEDICREYGASFVRHPFEGHIEQKNWAISQAKYPHILSLDADEVISDSLKKSILEAKNNWKYDGYYFNRLTNYCGKWIRHSSWYPSRKLRLWDSRKGKWGGMNPHDRFILEKGATKKFLKGDVLHYSYYSITEHIQQINKFSDIVARSFYKEGKRASYFNILFHPLWRLFRDYVIKLGFLDGFYGMVISVNSAHETFLKYSKLRRIYKEEVRADRDRLCFFNSLISWGGGEKWHHDISTRLIRSGYKAIAITNKDSELYKRISVTGIKTYQVPVSNLSFLNPFKIMQLVRIFKKEKVRTLIVNLSSDLKVAGLAAKLSGVDNVIYRRGSAIPIRNTALNRFIYKNLVTEIIANSEETRRTILHNNPRLFDSNKIRIIYNGIDLTEYGKTRARVLYKRHNGEIILGNAGRLTEEKGHIYLLELARELKKRNANFKILIAGSGKLNNKLRKTARMYDVHKEVKFLGFVKNIRSFNRTIDIFLLTSLWEGFGYVMVEAMAEERPVVAFDIRSSAEIIDDGKTGFLAEKGNVEDLADKVSTLMNSEELRKEFGQHGKEKVEQIFTIDKALRKVEDLLEELPR
ncbi:MAG: glycosyltransferase [Bacteroidales bacterium]|nr:glycosyltransferase [Bacteroidales bacterium]